VFGAVSCAADDYLGTCQCARHLVVGDLTELAVTSQLKHAFGVISEGPAHKDIATMPLLDDIGRINDIGRIRGPGGM
jgi:hypothetical protein